MEGEGTTPEGLPAEPPPQASDLRTTDLPGASLVRRPMLTVDGDPATLDPSTLSDIGRIPHPEGKPVVMELPTDPAALSADAVRALADIADGLPASAPPVAGQKKAGHDGPAKSNREVKKMSAKHHRLREPR